MPRLREDHRDWVPDNNGLQYRLGSTALGNTSINDVSNYIQRGEEWSGGIINITNIEVNKLMDRADYHDGIINILFARIDEVQDPTTGLLSPLQIVINNIFNMQRGNAITAGDFDDLRLTAGEYDDMQITAFDFDTNGRIILMGGI